MVEKALVSGGIRFGTLRAVDQVTESFSGDFAREIAEEDTAFDDNWNRRQCHTDGGDAGGSMGSLVTNQAIVRVGFMEVQDRGELQQAEILSVSGRVRSESPGMSAMSQSIGSRNCTRTLWVFPSLLSGLFRFGSPCPSNSIDRTPVPVLFRERDRSV